MSSNLNLTIKNSNKIILHKSILVPLIFFLFLNIPLSAEPINLSKGDVYARRGFFINWTDKMPTGDKWLKLKVPERLRSFRVKDLGLKGVPRRKMFSLKTFNEEDFTFLFLFNMKTSISDFPGIYIQDMGVKWEVYINGKLIMQNFNNKNKSGAKRDRSLRKVLAFINPGYLKKENNIAAFRLRGNPADPITGFYRNKIIIDDYETLNRNRSELITLILIFIYISFGFYHLFLFINNRQETYNLFFGLASISYFLYIFARTRSIYTLFSSPHFVTKFEFVMLYTLTPLFGSFIELVLFGKIKRFTRYYNIFSILLIALTLFTPLAFTFDVLRVWQFTALFPILYYTFVDIGFSFFNKIKMKYTGTKGEKKAGILLRSILWALCKTVEGNLIIGFFIIVGCAIFDILDAVYFNYGIIATKYGFFFFIMGIGLILSNRFLYMLKEIESLNISLTKKIDDLNKANMVITLSEEKYRTLVEGTKDMIFSLDENLMFITANRSLKKTLNVDDRKLKGKKFTDLFSNNEGEDITAQLIREKIDLLINKKVPIQFRTNFRSFFEIEPQEMRVQLESINVEGKNEILGKATRIVEDSLVKYFISERQSYEIGNFFIIAEEISHRVTKNLMKFMNQKQVDVMRIAVREMVVNAIEHGNLNITYDEKNHAMENGNFFELYFLRQQNPLLKKKKVKIEYEIYNNNVQYKIEDEGNGFDYRTILENINRANIEMRSHGRGILMAKNVFDSIEYNKKGNRVILTKKL